ncbi:MAG: hypothetical protein ACFHX7_04755 [Pseudomonadota bacterium]
MKTLACFLLLLTLAGCGGNGADSDPPAPPAEKAANPLAAQQQTLKDAAAIQGLLDKNAEEKKRAVQNAN